MRHRSPGGQQEPRVPAEERRYASARIQGNRSTTGTYRVGSTSGAYRVSSGTYRVSSSGANRVSSTSSAARARVAAPAPVARGRGPSHSSAVRGRVVIAAVAFGAFAAAAAGQTLQGAKAAPNDLAPLADGSDASALLGMGGEGPGAPDILTVARTTDGALEAQKMAESERINQARAAEAKAKQEEATRAKYVRPTDGTLTSGFGARWGTTHYGVDIANRLGTPIRAVADGVVIEAGPASGFGNWVRIQHADGYVSVYGHMSSFSVREGQQVKAGEQIARMGDEGYSTGPHLHFEVWDASGKKINPVPWLAARGVKI